MASRDEIIRFVFEVTGDEQLASAVKAMLDAGDAGDEANSKIAKLVDELSQLGDASRSIDAFVRTKAGLKEVTDQLASAQTGLAGLSKEFGSADGSSRAVTKAFAAAERAVADLTSQQRALQVEFAKAQGALQKAGVDTTNLAAANEDLKRKATGVADQIAAAGNEAKKSGKNLHDAGDGAKHLADESSKSSDILGVLRDNLGKIVSGAAAVKLALEGIQFGKERFKEAADLEESLVRVRALAGAAQQSLAGFEAGIDDAAEKAGVSANMAAAALSGLVTQGRSADEAMQALVPTLLLAKTAQLDVAQAAGIVDGALSQFGGTAADAAEYVDVLVSASKGSKDGIAGLADGIQKLAPLARDLNLSFKDTVGILGFMTRNGLSAADASKGLASIFRDLADPASRLRQELFALGDGTSDFDTAIKTLANSGDRGKQAILGLDDSTRKVVLFLQQQGVQGLAQFRAGLDNVSGAAAELDKAIGDNLNGAWGDFTRALDTIGAKLAQPVLEPLKVELQSLALKLNEFAKSPAFAELQNQIGDLARNGVEALDSLLKGIDWTQFVEGARSAIADASSSIASVKDDLQGVADTINVVASVLGVLYRSFAVVFDGAKILISGAVAGSAQLGVVIGQTIDKINGTESAYTRAMESIRDASLDAANNGVDALASNGEKLKENLAAIAGASGPASSGLAAVGATAKKVHESFANVAAGVESTRAALQHFDVPPGTFSNVVSGAEQAGKAMADLATRTADAKREADAAQANFDRLARSGQSNSQAFMQAAVALDQANQRLHALQGQAAAASASTTTLAVAFKNLGITAQQDVAQGADTAAAALDKVFAAYQAGAATIEDVRAAFDAYAAKQLEAVKNSDEWKQQQVKDALAVKEAMLGVAATKPSPDFKAPTQDAKGLQTQAEQTGEAVAEVGKKGAEGGKEISDAFAQLSGIYAGWTNTFNGTSKSAALRFQELTKAIFEFGVSSNTYIQADTTGIAKLGYAITEASRQTQKEIDEQKMRVQELSAQYEGMSAKAIQAMAAQQGSAEGLARSLEAQAAAAREGESGLQLLGAADLGPLASALDGVAAKARQLAEQAESARESFANMAAGLDEQIAQANGDLQQAENVRFQNALENLRKTAEESGTLNSAEYNDAVAKTTALHNIKMKQLQEQADAQRKSDEEAAARKRELESSPSRTESAPSPSPSSGPELGVIRFDIGGQTVNVRGTRETAADLQALVRVLDQQRRLQPGRGGGRGGVFG